MPTPAEILQGYLDELFGPATPGKLSQEQVERFTDEESRVLKAHISGNLTKYINNLKLNTTDSEPFMYNFMQGIIGVTTLYFYYCAVPAIIHSVVKEITLEEFHVLLFDPIFRLRWFHNIPVTHTYNEAKTTYTSSSARVDDSFYTKDVNLHTYEKTTENTFENRNFYSIFMEYVPKTKLDDSQKAIIRPLFVKFGERMDAIYRFVTTHTLSQCLNDNAFLQCIEDLRTIYLFYFKGGNSIRQIITSTNKYLDPSISIQNIDDIIPYGSDFDTNLLTNPFLHKNHFNNLSIIFNFFIPQISQYISIPDVFKAKLSNPRDADTKLTGTSDEQELQMYNLVYGYSHLNVDYLNKPKRDKAIQNFKKEHDRRFFVSPQSSLATGIVHTKITQTDISGNLISQTMASFPTLAYKKDDIIRKHMIIGALQDNCFESLQYSINLSIPKFQLNRYFLKFKLGERLTKTNLKHRLIDIDGTFNAEMLDISIVTPDYTINTDAKTYSCELLDLWLTSSDIYKFFVDDKYGLMKTMKDKLPTFGTAVIGIPPRLPKFPVFVNSIDMQINDLTLTVKDTLLEKKYEKLTKRLNRLLTLHYVKAVSPYYEKNPIMDMLYYDNIANLETPIPVDFFNIIGIKEDTVKDDELKLKHIRGLYEYYTAQFESTVYKDLSNVCMVAYSYNGTTTKDINLHDFIGQLMGHYLTTVIFIDPSSLNIKTSSDTVYGFHSFLLKLFDISSPTTGNEFITFTNDTTLPPTKSVTKNIGPCTLTYITKVFKIKNDNLSLLIKNAENNYRIPSFFVACLTWCMYKGAIQIDEVKLHPSMSSFIKFALQETTYAPPALPAGYGYQPLTPTSFTTSSSILVPVDLTSIKFQIIQTLAFISEKIQQKVNLGGSSYIFNLITEAPELYTMLVSCFQRLSYFDSTIATSIVTKLGNDLTPLFESMYEAVIDNNPTILTNFVMSCCDHKRTLMRLKHSYTIYLKYTDRYADNYIETFHYNPFLSNAIGSELFLQHCDTKVNSKEEYTNETIVYAPLTNLLYILDVDTTGNSFIFTPVTVASILNVFNTITGITIQIEPDTGRVVGGGAASGKPRKSRRNRKAQIKSRRNQSNRKTYKSRRI